MQKDYIMRIVEQFVQAILSMIRRRKNGEYKEARAQVSTAARYLLRMDIDLLLLFNLASYDLLPCSSNGEVHDIMNALFKQLRD